MHGRARICSQQHMPRGSISCCRITRFELKFNPSWADFGGNGKSLRSALSGCRKYELSSENLPTIPNLIEARCLKISSSSSTKSMRRAVTRCDIIPLASSSTQSILTTTYVQCTVSSLFWDVLSAFNQPRMDGAGFLPLLPR